ncbi:hypothetical protein GCM10010123_46310 [Pilimelia anulata]|uniref:Ferritin-like domain-containing protein n=1 Tax=Pilimelia anulata TaxID=53371 RepID=A0A8J3BHU8_9ACTN|nr:ferritin-like domain-containing protein [Pilimelia anulata]GGK11080.1 hypothetical protein GCM10010123_46310 [Pilimelia anulata]
MLQTVAALENLLVFMYRAVLSSVTAKKFSSDLRQFFGIAVDHHVVHTRDMNGLLTAAKKKPQAKVHPTYEAFVRKSLAKHDPNETVALALLLEDVIAQTYTKFAPRTSDESVRLVMARTAAVEVQHRVILSAAQSLSAAHLPGGIRPKDLGRLPESFVNAVLPTSTYPTDKAADPESGSVR